MQDTKCPKCPKTVIGRKIGTDPVTGEATELFMHAMGLCETPFQNARNVHMETKAVRQSNEITIQLDCTPISKELDICQEENYLLRRDIDQLKANQKLASLLEDYADLHAKTEHTPDLVNKAETPLGAGIHEHNQMVHAAIGLATESAEVLDLFKKDLFGYHYTGKQEEELIKELGDVFWYLFLMCKSSGISLTTIIEGNMAKLRARYAAKLSKRNIEGVCIGVTLDDLAFRHK